MLFHSLQSECFFWQNIFVNYVKLIFQGLEIKFFLIFGKQLKLQSNFFLLLDENMKNSKLLVLVTDVWCSIAVMLILIHKRYF